MNNKAVTQIEKQQLIVNENRNAVNNAERTYKKDKCPRHFDKWIQSQSKLDVSLSELARLKSEVQNG